MYMIVEVSQYVAVASFSEAWIEMTMASREWIEKQVASFSEAWIEILGSLRPACSGSRRLLLGGVD